MFWTRKKAKQEIEYLQNQVNLNRDIIDALLKYLKLDWNYQKRVYVKERKK